MAATSLGSYGMESAVRALTPGESVIVLARNYDKLIKDLEFALGHLDIENLSPELRALIEKRDA